jgi:hypothetical protein
MISTTLSFIFDIYGNFYIYGCLLYQLFKIDLNFLQYNFIRTADGEYKLMILERRKQRVAKWG